MIGRRRRRAPEPSAGAPRRRSGPPEEVPWWDPADQARAEQELVARRDLGRGWLEASMLNNVERLDPHGTDPDSEALRAIRQDRRPTALDEGRAWRQRTTGTLVVLRVEAFATADDGTHRAAWRRHGEASVGATWRDRWRERDLVPGWIEARWADVGERQDRFLPAEGDRPWTGDDVPALVDAVDWLRVEDHTDHIGAGEVVCYQHLTAWLDRWQLTVTVRHPLDVDEDPVAAQVVATAWARARAAG